MNEPGWSHPAFAAIAESVQARAGLSFPSSRRHQAEAALARAMAKAAIRDPAIYAAALLARPDGLDPLIAELVVGETYFFRDPAQLDHIRQVILPALRAPWTDRRLRVWSAGCASGEELYTLAILLEEEGWANRAELLGSDISTAALTRARAGCYGAWSFRGVSPELRERYFTASGARHRIAEQFRARVEFAPINLARDLDAMGAAGRRFDLILCRNVLIYLDDATIRRIAERLRDLLAEDGWLVTGPSDPLLSQHAAFEPLATPGGICYRGRAAPGRSRPDTPPRSQELAIPPPRRRPRPVPAPALPPRAAAGSMDWVGRIRGAAGAGDLARAESMAAEAARRHPLVPELHFLHAVLLADLGRGAEAAKLLHKVIYLDRTLALAHVVLGSVQHRLGKAAEARRCYRNAYELIRGLPAGAPLRLAEGQAAGQLAAAMRIELGLAPSAGEAPS